MTLSASEMITLSALRDERQQLIDSLEELEGVLKRAEVASNRASSIRANASDRFYEAKDRISRLEAAIRIVGGVIV